MAHKVVIPEDITEPGKEFLRSKGYEVVVVDGNTSEAFEKEAKNADALLVRTAKYPKEILEKMPNLKVIGRHGVGYDNIDVDYCCRAYDHVGTCMRKKPDLPEQTAAPGKWLENKK